MAYNGLQRTPLGLSYIANTLIHLYLHANGITSIASMEGINFVRLRILDLSKNRISHLRPEFLITPNLELLNLGGNNLFLLADVTQYSWGSSLLKHEYMTIHLQMNPWHCNGSLIWMLNNLYKMGRQTIYAKPPFKPILTHVQRLVCMSPDGRRGTRVVPRDIIENITINIHSLHDGKCYPHFASNECCNLTKRTLLTITINIGWLLNLSLIHCLFAPFWYFKHIFLFKDLPSDKLMTSKMYYNFVNI